MLELLTEHDLSIPHQWVLKSISSFVFLALEVFGSSVPPAAFLTLKIIIFLLLLRRAWLFIAKKEFVPPSFKGATEEFGKFNAFAFSIALVFLVLAMMPIGGSARYMSLAYGGVLLFVLGLSVLISFFITEIGSLNCCKSKRET